MVTALTVGLRLSCDSDVSTQQATLSYPIASTTLPTSLPGAEIVAPA